MTSRELPKILPTEVREHLARAREALNETDPAGGPVTEHTEPRLTAQDLREAVGLVLWYKAGRLHPDPDALAARLEAHADRLDALWAVLDAAEAVIDLEAPKQALRDAVLAYREVTE